LPVPTSAKALIMRSDPSACHETAATLERLGFAVSEFVDECHLYAHAIRLATSAVDPGSFVIVAEPASGVVQDLEILRSASWRTPLVLVGQAASVGVASRLRAACLPCERPTGAELRRAIDEALALASRFGPVGATLPAETARLGGRG
jgi:hypothetical protein